MKRKTDLDRVWRAVIRRTFENGTVYVEYHGPFSRSNDAAAAVTRAIRQGYHRATTTGDVESATTVWKPRDE